MVGKNVKLISLGTIVLVRLTFGL